MNILVTGAAGFIGSTVSLCLLDKNINVIGVDNLNDYYDVSLKETRLSRLKNHTNFKFIKLDIADQKKIEQLFKDYSFDVVINLAAQAGVRYASINPHAYIQANLVGFCNILEGCRHHKIKHLLFASSSSVYGANNKQPFSEHDSVDHPLSLYAATKKANELMAHTYANLYQLPVTGLRFFTVYGPWGRPDMALFKFTKQILAGEPIDVYNYGDMIRDFTYVDDIVEGIIRLIDKLPQPNTNWNSKNPDPATSFVPYRIYNIGNNNPVKLMDFIEAIEKSVGKKAIKNLMSIQPGDVPSTYADTTSLWEAVDFKPSTSIEDGVQKFVAWYRDYYQI